ncbi:MAG: MFS transporter [Clostridia bacterium]|nr:MFS transporter [Clostridia bacterium]
MRQLKNYKHTIYACYLAYTTQAIVVNFVPLLFLVFAADYGISLDKITMITTINFLVQLTVDLLSTKFLDKIGYRTAAILAHAFAAVGLLGLAVFTYLPNEYLGILISVVLYAIGGGLLEVIVSPIVEACPTDSKAGAMSLLHAFYCWGQVAVILISTAFFTFVGIEKWKLMACLWAVIPLVNIPYFTVVPIYSITGGHEPMPLKKLLGQKLFWLLLVLMVCSGASEQAMAQWASYFAEDALGVSKAVGDLAGPCAFGILMGVARTIYGKYSDKLPLKNMMLGGSVLCFICYLLAIFAANPIMGLLGCAFCGFAVGIFWPGTLSIAAGSLPAAGAAMYALLALGGDIGCSLGPTIVGLVASANGDSLKTGLLPAVIFPCLIFAGILILKKRKSRK